MQDTQVLLLHEEGFQQPAPYHSQDITENANIFFMFPKKHSHKGFELIVV